MSAPVSMTVRIARVIYRALLILVPGTVRQRYRAEMLATFDAASAEAGARGPVQLCRLLINEAIDLSTAGRSNRPDPVTLSDAPTARSFFALFPGVQASAWRQAWRSLRRRPAFLGAAVATLAAGAGITTAVFSLVDTVLIKPLPYPDPESLVTV